MCVKSNLRRKKRRGGQERRDKGGGTLKDQGSDEIPIFSHTSPLSQQLQWPVQLEWINGAQEITLGSIKPKGLLELSAAGTRSSVFYTAFPRLLGCLLIANGYPMRWECWAEVTAHGAELLQLYCLGARQRDANWLYL